MLSKEFKETIILRSKKFLALGLLALALPVALLGASQSEARAVELDLMVAPRAFREDGAAPRGRLARRGTSLPALTVQLRSTDTRFIVPATVTFAQGERQLYFPIRLVNDVIINDRASNDGFRTFNLYIGGAGIPSTEISLKILDDEPFRLPRLSPVRLERFEALGDSKNVARLVFSGPVSFNPSKTYGTPQYGLGINGLMDRVARLQVINRQVLLITFDRDFAPGDIIAIAAYNLTDAHGLPLPDQLRSTVVPFGPPFSIAISKSKFREDAGANASRVTIRLAYAVARPLTFTLSVNAPGAMELSASTLPESTLPRKISAPASVTIPAGARAISFPVAAIDNDVVDGDTFNRLAIQAPFLTRPAARHIRFVIVDNERAPVSDVRIVRAARLAEGGVRLKLSGSIRNLYNLEPSGEKFLIRIGARSFHPLDSISVDSSGTVVDIYTGVNLPSTEEVTVTISGLRDSTLAVIPVSSITLPPVPSTPSA